MSDIGDMIEAGGDGPPWDPRNVALSSNVADYVKVIADQAAENLRLRAVIEAMAGGDIILSQATKDGSWQWAKEPDEDSLFYYWHGSFPSAADAALAAKAEQETPCTSPQNPPAPK